MKTCTKCNVEKEISLFATKRSYCIKLIYYSKINNIDISQYSLFIKKLKYTKSNSEKIGWRLGNQDGIVKII